MIKADLGTVMVSGTKLVISSELTTIIKALVEECDFDKESIYECVDLAFMSEEEVVEHIKRMKDELFNSSIGSAMADMLRSVADTIEKGKED